MMPSSEPPREISLEIHGVEETRRSTSSRAAATGRAEARANSRVPQFWTFRWLPQVRPRYFLGALILAAVLMLAGGWAAVIIAAQTACEGYTNHALLDLLEAAGNLEKGHTAQVLSALNFADTVRQQPKWPGQISSWQIEELAKDMHIHSSHNQPGFWLAPAGVIHAHNESLGLNLFEDPAIAADVQMTVETNQPDLLGPLDLPESPQIFIKLVPIFVPGPVENRSEAFGFPDASNCNACYTDPNKVFWGFLAIEVDFEEILASGHSFSPMHHDEGHIEDYIVVRVGEDGEEETLYPSNGKEPYLAGGSVLEVPLKLDMLADTILVRVKDPQCKSWAPWGGIACTTLVLLGLLLGLKSLHLLVQNNSLQHLELQHMHTLLAQHTKDNMADKSEAIRRMILSLLAETFKKRWLQQEAQQAAIVEQQPKVHNLTRRLTSSINFSKAFHGQQPMILGGSMGRALQQSQNLASLGGSMKDAPRSPSCLSIKSMEEMRIQVVLQIPQFQEMQDQDMGAVRRLCMLLKELCFEALKDCGGINMEEDNSGAVIADFKNSNDAILFALTARRALMWSAWSDDICALPGCEATPLLYSFQKSASGPRVKAFISMAHGVWSLSDVARTCLKHMYPWQILVTGDVWSQVTRLQDAGLPFVRELGRFNIQKGQDLVMAILEIHEPRWDLRLPQLALPRKLRMARVMGPTHNLCPMPTQYKSRGLCSEPSIPAALMQLHKGTGNLSVASIEMINQCATSLTLLFRGHTAPAPIKWSVDTPVAVFFPSLSAAVAFNACFQMLLANANWPDEDVDRFHVGDDCLLTLKSVKSGPGIKCAIVAAPQSIAEVLSKAQDTSNFRSFATAARISYRNIRKNAPEWSAWDLLDLAFPGQILMSGSLLEETSLSRDSSTTLVEVIHMGRHILHSLQVPESDDGVIDICEIRVPDLGPRTFPPLMTKQCLVKGYLSSPDASGKSAFVNCQAIAPQDANITSSAEYIESVKLWKTHCRSMLSTYGGYECVEKSLALSLVFCNLEGAIAFAVTMQQAAMGLAYPKELLDKEEFKPQYDSDMKMIACGLGIKVAISYGTPVVRQPAEATGYAVYRGPCVSRSIHILQAAYQGQVLVEAEPLLSLLDLPEADPTTMEDEDSCCTLDMEDFNFPHCNEAFVRVLKGSYQLKRERYPMRLACVSLPELSGRTFPEVKGRAVLQGSPVIDDDDCDRADDEQRRHTSSSGDSGLGKDLSLLINNILDKNQALNGNTAQNVQILGVLGQGSQGKVLHARWKGVQVAYKITTLSSGNASSKAQAHALMELAISATMSHPNIVQTYSYQLVQVPLSKPDDHADSSHFSSENQLQQEELDDTPAIWEARMIQELCTGKTLRHNLDRKKFTLPRDKLPHTNAMLKLAAEVASGLSHIHSNNIVHGDLKAGNILLCRSQSVTRNSQLSQLPSMTAKVADFGLSAKLADGSTHLSDCFSGTITHMAPEVMLAGQVSKGADVYAFGIMLFEMFTGRRAFGGLTHVQVTNAVATNNRRPVFDADVPRQIVQLACDCWGPLDKRPSIDSVLQRLMQLQKTVKHMPTKIPDDVDNDDKAVLDSIPDRQQSLVARRVSSADERKFREVQTDRSDNDTEDASDGEDHAIDIKKLQMQGSVGRLALRSKSMPEKSLKHIVDESVDMPQTSTGTSPSCNTHLADSRRFFEVLKRTRAEQHAKNQKEVGDGKLGEKEQTDSDSSTQDRGSKHTLDPVILNRSFRRTITWGNTQVMSDGSESAMSSTTSLPFQEAQALLSSTEDGHPGSTSDDLPSENPGKSKEVPILGGSVRLVIDTSDDDDSGESAVSSNQ